MEPTRPAAPLLTRRTVLAWGAGAVLTGALGVGLARSCSADPAVVTGSFTFAPPGRKPIPVHYAYGAGDLRDATIVIVMHGDSRNALGARDAWARAMINEPIIAVAPEFTEADFPGSDEYNLGGILDPSGAVRPRDQWTFAYVRPLFEEMRRRVAGRQTTFDLFGHSAGGQFTHRYVEFAPDPALRRAFAANAGWYTMPDPTVNYPYGVRKLPSGVTIDWATSFGKRMTVMAGDQDLLDEGLRHTANADAQGMTRWERAHTFMTRAGTFASSLGIASRWQLEEVAGVGHDHRAMSARAIELLRAG